MPPTLNATAGDISEVGQRRDVGYRLSPDRQFVQRDKDAADEYHRESHRGGNHVYRGWYVGRRDREDITERGKTQRRQDNRQGKEYRAGYRYPQGEADDDRHQRNHWVV